MKYRKLDANGDYTLGSGGDFYEDSPEAVAQAILTRLRLWKGEWFLDTSEGTPWSDKVLGKRQRSKNYDAVLRNKILTTAGVSELLSYSSSFNGDTRRLTVTAKVKTIYGSITLNEVL